MQENERSTIGKLIDDLAQQRDELRLKIHLGSMEAQEQLQKLDDQLFQLRQRFVPTKAAIDETADDVWDALKLLGGEIKEGFDRIRKSL